VRDGRWHRRRCGVGARRLLRVAGGAAHIPLHDEREAECEHRDGQDEPVRADPGRRRAPAAPRTTPRGRGECRGRHGCAGAVGRVVWPGAVSLLPLTPDAAEGTGAGAAVAAGTGAAGAAVAAGAGAAVAGA
jgi:hypothetical protein